MRSTKRAAVITTTAAACLVGVSVGSASADPDNAPGAEVIALDCGADGDLEVLVQFSGSGVSVFDVAADERGRELVLTRIEGSFYEGEVDEEPPGDPVFAFAKEWGNRNGYSQTLHCATGPVVESDEFGTFTGFFSVTLSGK